MYMLNCSLLSAIMCLVVYAVTYLICHISLYTPVHSLLSFEIYLNTLSRHHQTPPGISIKQRVSCHAFKAKALCAL